MAEKGLSYFFGVLVCAVVLSYVFVHSKNDQYIELSEYKSAVPVVATSSQPILFVGDVMLARYVETHMRADGVEYPFTQVRDVLKGYGAVIGNFEATIPQVHEQTPALSLVFSVDASLAEALKTFGFTHLTLANNHAYDYGASAYLHTVEVLRGFGLMVGGRPEEVTIDDVHYIDAHGLTIALVPVYAVTRTPDSTRIHEVLSAVASSSDMQIVYVHWGEEYSLQNVTSQEELAHTFIDAGADAVIGHHPHVIENIELYQGAPIFYSLGNFIFDQYWNSDVQTGLAVAVARKDETLEFTLLPIASEESVPHFLSGDEKTAVLQALAARSDEGLGEGIRAGVLEIPFRVSTSSLASRP